jgi:Tfp pilus assembly protein PilF/O-antigen ligase
MTTDRWDRWMAGLLEAGWLLCALGVALFMSPFLALTFTADKVLLFRMIVELLALGALLHWLRRPRLRPAPLTLGLGAFAVIMTVATFCGRNPIQGFWGSYMRLFGLFTLLHGGALYLVVAAHFRGERQWRRLLLGIGGLSLVVGIHALLQWRGLEQPVMALIFHKPGFHWTALGGEAVRPFASLGNASYLGTFLVFAIAFALGGLISAPRRWRWPVGALLGLLLFVLVLNQTRGAWLGAAAAAFTFAMLTLRPERRRLVAIGAAGLLGATLMLGIAAARSRDAAWVASNPALRRLASFSQRDTNSSGWYRLDMWRRLGKDVAASPAALLLGYGPESYQLVSSRSFVPVYADGSEGAQFMDSTHNIFLDTLVDGGLLGLGALLAVLFLAFRTGLRALRAGPTPLQRAVLATALAALVGYLVQGMFLFNHVVSLAYLCLTLGLITAAGRGGWGEASGPAEAAPAPRRPWAQVLAAGAAGAIVLLVLLPANLRAYHAQRLKRQADELAAAGRATEATGRLRDVCRLVPYERHYAVELANSIVTSVPPGSDPEEIQAAFRAAERELRRAIALDPGDVRIYWPLGLLYQFWGTFDRTKFAAGEEVYRRAAALSPRRQRTYWAMGDLLLAQGRQAEALVQYRTALELDPSVSASQRALARCYVRVGQPEHAEPLFTRGWETLRRSASAFARPEQAAEQESLGLAFLERGRADKARVHLTSALALNPALPRAREALEQLAARQALSPAPVARSLSALGG